MELKRVADLEEGDVVIFGPQSSTHVTVEDGEEYVLIADGEADAPCPPRQYT